MNTTSSTQRSPRHNAAERLACADVTIRQGDAQLLRGVNWTVRAGEHWAVLGGTGAGKSVLARAILGDAYISRGAIHYGGGRDDGMEPASFAAGVSFRLQQALVAQPDGYHQSRWYPGEGDAAPTATLEQLLRGAAAHAGLRGAAGERALRRAVNLLGLRGLEQRRALALSNGELRRTLIARALLREPKLLVLDEPLIGLDAATRAVFTRQLQQLMRAQRTVLLFTSRPADVPPGITHLLFLRHGRVLGACAAGSRERDALTRAAFSNPPARVALPLSTRSAGTATRARRTAAPPPVAEVRALQMNAGSAPLFQGLNWTVRAGERWALRGPNGSGKTTLLSLLTGDHPQSHVQDIRLFGKARGGQTVWDWKAKTGWAAPELALHYRGDVSALELICSGYFDTLALYTNVSPARQRAARAWLRAVGLQAHAHTPFRVLSDGQQRLVLLARALVKRPRLVILDEPCQGLDAAARGRVLALLDAYCRATPCALIYVTHFTDELPHAITHTLELPARPQ